MDIGLIGNQIQKYRKQLGLTQRELGAAIGVSTQAVSQWENGGAPDVALLPAIADRLGVTVDALFGREGGEVRDIKADAAVWIRSMPEDARARAVAELVWHVSVYGFSSMDMPELTYMKTCEYTDEEGRLQLMKSLISNEGGFFAGVPAEDMSFMAVFPEPREGYERFLLDNDRYRELFSVLAGPGVLEVIRYLCRQEAGFHTVCAVARHLGLGEEDTEAILEKLSGINLLARIRLNAGDGVIFAYCLPNQESVVPLLCFSRWVMDNIGAYYLNLGRARPALRRREERKDEEK